MIKILAQSYPFIFIRRFGKFLGRPLENQNTFAQRASTLDFFGKLDKWKAREKFNKSM